METDLRASRVPPLVLVVVDQPVLAEVVALAWRHGHLHARVAPSAMEADVALKAAQHHFAIVDADIGDGAILDRLGSTSGGEDRIPVVSLNTAGISEDQAGGI